MITALFSPSDTGGSSLNSPRYISSAVLGKTVSDTTDYIGSVIYEGRRASTVRFEGGYASFSPLAVSSSRPAPTFHYYIPDYLGNNRAVVNEATGAMEQITHYYPWGGVYADLGTGAAVQPFKYGDKELDLSNGIARYDYTARAYVPATLRFDRLDRYTGDYPHISPYAFCANNPVNILDPSGNQIIQIYNGIIYTYSQNESGEWGFYDEKGNQYTGRDYFSEPLKKIRQSDIALDYMIQCIAQHPTQVILCINTSPELENECEVLEDLSMRIIYEPDKRKGGLGITKNGDLTTSRDGEAGLAHELGHAFEYMYSKQLAILKYLHPNLLYHSDNYYRSEIISGIAENIYREANGNPIRLGYKCIQEGNHLEFNNTQYNYSLLDKWLFRLISFCLTR